jgi:hypothetical protein
VHLDAGLLQEAPGRPLRRLDVPTYFSGGTGFVAVGAQQRYEVRLRDAPPTRRSVRSDLVFTTRGSTRALAGVCSVIEGDQHPGRVVKPGALVRTAPRLDAPAVADRAALPFVWTYARNSPRAVPSPPAGWVAVTLWRADGRRSEGFLPRPAVRLIPQVDLPMFG